MSKHTPEPWAVDEEDALIRTNRNGSGEQDYICMLADQSNDFGESWDTMEFCGSNRNGEIKANARRIVACVNACAGIGTERLESGSPEWWGRYVRDDRPAMEREIAKLQAERDEWQTRAEQYETAWVNENAANCELTEEIAKLRAEREELQRRVDGFRDEFLEKALEWRGISFVDEACDGCGGSGVVAYGSTSTWHGGIGGQAVTNGVCDKCWGSGNKHHKWADLRKLRAALAEEV